MKKIGMAIAVLALAISPTSAALFGFGAHNPSWVDHPEIVNCTLFGENTWTRHPECETWLRYPPMTNHVHRGVKLPPVPVV